MVREANDRAAWLYLVERELGPKGHELGQRMADDMGELLGVWSPSYLTDDRVRLIARFIWSYNRLGGEWNPAEGIGRTVLGQLIALFELDGWDWHGKLAFLEARRGWRRGDAWPLTLTLMTWPDLHEAGRAARDKYVEAARAKGV